MKMNLNLNQRFLTAFGLLSTVLLLSVSNLWACDMPRFIHGRSATTTGLTVAWDAVPTAQSYQLTYRRVSEPQAVPLVRIANTNALELTNLMPNETYAITVRALCANGAVSGDGIGTVATLALPAGPCDMPTRLAASGTGLLTWDGVPAAQNYLVVYRIANDSRMQSFVTDRTTFQIENLLPNTRYEANVRANCANGSSNFAQVSFDFMGNDPTCIAPGQPFVLSTNVSINSVIVNWNTVPGAVAYDVYFRPAGAANFSYHQTVISAQASIGNLMMNTNYEVRVESMCSNGRRSNFSPIASFTTLSQSPCNLDASIIPIPEFCPGTAPKVSVRVSGLLSNADSWTIVYTENGQTKSYSARSNGIFTLTTEMQRFDAEYRIISITTGFCTQNFNPILVSVAPVTPFVGINLFVNQNVSFSEGNDGILTVRLAGESARGFCTRGYQYSLNGIDYQNNNSFFGLPAGVYTVHVRDLCNQCVAVSNSVTITEPSPCATRPTISHVRVISQTSAQVFWQSSFGNVFELEYRKSGSGPFMRINSITTFDQTLTELECNTAYEVRVRGNCENRTFSTFSPSVLFSTEACPAQNCFRPSLITIVPQTASSVSLSWNPISTAACYQISYGPANLADELLTTFSVSHPSTTTSLTGLVPGTTYKVRLRTVCNTCNAANSVFSDFTPTFNYMMMRDGEFTWNESANSLQIYPNPTTGLTALVISPVAAGTAAVSVVDITGQTVYEQSFEHSSGQQVLNVDWSGLAAGIYVVRTNVNGQLQQSKLMKN
jgi:hypothetical protein